MFLPILKSCFRSMTQTRRAHKRLARCQTLAAAEVLEDRILLAVRTWDGGGATADFGLDANWQPDSAPTAADIANLITTDEAEIFGYTQDVKDLNASSGADFRIL